MRTLDHFGVRRPERLADVARLGLDREEDRRYLHDTVERAALALGTPFAVLDVLLDDAQVFLAATGPVPEWIREAGGTPLEWSFCLPLVRDRVPRAVADLAADPMFQNNPLVTIEGARSYAGAPLISRNGHVLGGLCALDFQPRHFGADQLGVLEALAAEAVGRIEAHAVEEALR